jgi:hypothetical protein
MTLDMIASRTLSLLCCAERKPWSGHPVKEGTREIYASANGDRWYLTRDPQSGHAFVQHVPNAPSGGQVSDIDIGTFLIRGALGPEHQALLRLIGTLIEEQSHTDRD